MAEQLLVDHASARPGAEAVRAAGYAGAVRYLANSPDRGMPNKILTPDEARGYLDRGMPLVSNWQKGKGLTADWKRGEAGGRADATQAATQHFLCGGSRFTPIFFSIDEDLSAREDLWHDLAAPYLRGAAAVLGHDWVGMYGQHDAIDWAIRDGLLGDAGGGRVWAWHTNTWHGKRGQAGVPHPRAVLWQRDIYPREDHKVAGIPVDRSVVLAPDFGQWGYGRADASAFLSALSDSEQRELLAIYRGTSA